MRIKYTYEQIAKNYKLWTEYAAPYVVITQEEFDILSVEEKVQMQIEASSNEA